MPELLDPNVMHVMRAILIGVGATAFMDIVAAARTRWFAVPSADYALVGRWLVYLAHGRFRHDAIAASPLVRGERLIGWTAHYVIGVMFAVVLLAIWGLDWACDPTIVPALIVGIASVAAPFLLMQPGMGAGIAASRTAHPAAARLRSFSSHAIFGVGLYAAGWASRWITNVFGTFHCGVL
jgi:hypothetical protein